MALDSERQFLAGVVVQGALRDSWGTFFRRSCGAEDCEKQLFSEFVARREGCSERAFFVEIVAQEGLRVSFS